MSDKNLATIQTITDIQPIPDADQVEVAKVLGWKCVVKKNEFKVGDKCVYVAIDTVVPDDARFEFLRKVHFRIKTCRIRKQLSQGIVFPLSILNNTAASGWTLIVEGTDVTDIVGIKKYEKPVPKDLNMKGGFPSHTPKTDEIMVQSIPKILTEIAGKEVYITVKCDGTSATFSSFNGEIDVCSRNWSLKDGNNVYWQMFKKYAMDKIFGMADRFSIQGEIVGVGVQGNKMGLTELDLYVFQVYDIFNAKYLDYEEFKNFCQAWGLKTVPHIKTCAFNFTMEELIEMAKGTYDNGELREGIVIRPVVECYSPTIDNHDPALRGRMSFKVLNNDFVEKFKE